MAPKTADVDLIQVDEIDVSDEMKSKAKDEAIDIMKNGNPMKYVIGVLEEIHVGDDEIKTVVLLSVASQSCKNTQGMQPDAVGDSGSGKTHCIKTCLHTIRDVYILETSLTPKALYYSDIKPGTIVFSDDTDIVHEMETVIKRATSMYQQTTHHLTVIQQSAHKLEIPSRIMWVFTSVESQGSDQLMNRKITMNTETSAEHKEKIYDMQVKEALTGKNGVLDVTYELIVAREIHDLIKSNLFNVVIPYADKISIQDKSNSRNFPLFQDMIKSFAVYNFMQRTESSPGFINATEEDFYSALRVFDSQKESIMSKMDDKSRSIMRAIGDAGTATINSISHTTEIPTQTVRRIIEGRPERDIPGLVDTEKNLYVIDQSETDRTETYSRTSRAKLYGLRDYKAFDYYEGSFATLID